MKTVYANLNFEHYIISPLI